MYPSRSKQILQQVIAILFVLGMIALSVFFIWQDANAVSDTNVDNFHFDVSDNDSLTFRVESGNLRIVPVKEYGSLMVDLSSNYNSSKQPEILLDIQYENEVTFEKNCTLTFRNKARISTFMNDDITVYLPEKQYKTVRVFLGAGSVSIDSLKANTLITDGGIGSVSLTNCRLGSLQANQTVGEISVSGTTADNIQTDVSVGETTISLPKTTDGFTVNYGVSLGYYSVRGFRITTGRQSKAFTARGSSAYQNGGMNLNCKVGVGSLVINRK